MKVLLTVAFDGDREEFVEAMQAELASRWSARRRARTARSTSVPPATSTNAVRELDTEPGAAAMVSLWGVQGPADHAPP